MAKKDIRYLSCGKHGEKRRWGVVCVHLLDGSSTTWNSISQGPKEDKEGIFDWFCPECMNHIEEIVQSKRMEDIRPICCVCIDQIRFLLDRNYKEKSAYVRGVSNIRILRGPQQRKGGVI